MTHRIVIVGGGAGGLELATRLGRTLGKKGQAKEEIASLLLFLDEYTKKHFADEEKYMASVNYPELEKQQTMHRGFIGELDKLEKDYIDSALSVADSFKYYVKSTKILSDQVVKNQSDFIKYMKCILKHKLSGMNSFDYEKLREDISNNKTVRRKNWLLQKLEEIHESHSNK